MDHDEGRKLAMAYLLLDMRDLENVIDRVKRVGSCILASSVYHTTSKGPPPPPPPSDPKSKGKVIGKMDDLSGNRKDNATMAENVETSYGRSTPGQNELVLHLEQKILELQENAPDVFYIQNLKKKPTETFLEYASRWRSEAAKVRPPLEEEQMNKFYIRAEDPQYFERLIVIENYKFSDIIKLGERIEEWTKSGMMTNFEALQATNKALYSGGISKKKEVGAVMWVNPNKTCAYHSDMMGHTIEECRMLKDKIQTLIDTKVIQAKETTPNVRNNLISDHRGEGMNVIETDEEWDQEGSIGLIREGDAPKTSLITLLPIVVQTQVPFEVEVATPFTMMVAPTPSYKSDVVPWDYVAEARRKGKAKMEETGVAQGMTRTGRVYTLENLRGTSKETTSKPHIMETSTNDLWRNVREREYSVVDHLNKTPAQISILSLLQNSDVHKNALIKVLSEAYVPIGITNGEMDNMVGQVLESHKITFHEDKLPSEALNHNKVLHITEQYKDRFIVRVLIDGVSSLKKCPLTTLKDWVKACMRYR
ncbi:uncharacterized protein LOC142168102 [Nicotiana tabacum]|uniref:Uncharacterized protein LOC142168102 n=1 Tax=Nicotiana tabacum TaxID=4097 RepID=A0AC58SIQ5_TOBAC